MTIWNISILMMLTAIGGGLIYSRWKRLRVVSEDNVAVTVDKDGFIKRVLPSGRHVLQPFEKVEFMLEIKPRLASGHASTVVTVDGIPINVNWSGVYALEPELITEKLNQRLRSLLNAEKTITRNVDIALRKLVGDYTVQDLFKPAIRERIARQVNQVVAGKIRALGIVLTGLDLQVLELPREVAEALNKAKAIEALDGTIRHLDPTTREIVRGAYRLDEILHWDHYLPVPSRLTMKRLDIANSG